VIRRPPLFIGSSVEGLDVAYAIQENLEFDCEPTVWSQGVFQPNTASLTDLFAYSGRVEFAIFVFTPDDIIEMRGHRYASARDNVIFELGLFVGALGPTRCFYAVPHGEELHLPSDLIGVEPLRYVSNRSDGNLRAALGPASNRVRQALRSIAPQVAHPPTSNQRLSTPLELAELLWQQWCSPPLDELRRTLSSGVPTHMSDDATGEASKAISQVYQFLNSVADGVLTGSVDEALARRDFLAPMTSVWQLVYSYFVPLGSEPADAWNPIPPLGQLVRTWHQDAG